MDNQPPTSDRGPMTNPPPPGREPGQSRSDARYLAVVGALMVLIIAALAVLWVTENYRRRNAEADLAKYKQLSAIFGKGMPAMPLEGLRPLQGLAADEEEVQPVRREDLFPMTMTLDGQKKTVYGLSAAKAQRLGFHPGDVIVVSELPATQPASAPAGGQE